MWSSRGGNVLRGVAAVAVLAAPAEAKCRLDRYHMEVEVRSGRTSAPVQDVRLAVFADDSESEMPGVAGGSRTATGPDGKSARTYLFNTYSGAGSLHPERCEARPTTVTVVFIHPDYRVRRVALEKVVVPSPATGDVGLIVMPRVLMEPLQP